MLVAWVTSSAAGEGASDSQIEFSVQEISKIKSLGPWPLVAPSDPGNELSNVAWAEELGQKLFFDPIMSGSGTLSCASCHKPELNFSDGKALPSQTGDHRRNTLGLVDVAYQRWWRWDGSADSLWAATMRPLLSKEEMAVDIRTLAYRLKRDPRYSSELEAENKVTEIRGVQADTELIVRAAKSIAAYVRTLQSLRTGFDTFRDSLIADKRMPLSEYSAQARRGLKIFISQEANCLSCHFGPTFSNREFHNTMGAAFDKDGLAQAGRRGGVRKLRDDPFNLLGAYSHLQSDQDATLTRTVTNRADQLGQWRTPTLRGLAMTAPYFHDGSEETIRDVVDFYADFDMSRIHIHGESVLKPFALDEQERNDLVAFLSSLGGQQDEM